MSWRTIIISSSSKLDYQMGYLVVRNEKTTRVHLSEISVLIIESLAVSMTSYLLNELSSKNISIIFCDEKHNPRSQLNNLYGSHDTSNKIRKQILISPELKQEFWSLIVNNKIINQSQVLEICNFDNYKQLLDYSENVLLGDSSNCEGHAAKVYFYSLFGKKFSRRHECAINSALNYAYAILLSMVNREIVACGFITQIGLFHSNSDNPYNLASDLMEPFRPVIDLFVFNNRFQKFETEEKRKIMEVFDYEICYNNRKEKLSNVIGLFVKNFMDCLIDNAPDHIRFPSLKS